MANWSAWFNGSFMSDPRVGLYWFYLVQEMHMLKIFVNCCRKCNSCPSLRNEESKVQKMHIAFLGGS